MRLRDSPPSRVRGRAAFDGLVAGLTTSEELDSPIATSLLQHAKQLHEVVDLLKPLAGSSAAAAWAVCAFERWLADGGDLQRIMGLRARRGGAHELPQRGAKRRARDQALRKLAESLPIANRVKALAYMIQSNHAAVLVLRQEVGNVPSSPAQIARILRGK